MNYKDKIISAFARIGCEKVSGNVIRDLRKMTEGMQSGDDSNLKNIWDEICVQVQDVESAMWDFYVDVMGSLIQREVEHLDVEITSAIWLQTAEGRDWEIDIKWEIENEESEEPDTTEYNIDDITRYILYDFVLKAAANWTNRRIQKYLERGLEW